MNVLKEIKTIYVRSDRSDEFDRLVNMSICDGWVLTHRYYVDGFAVGNKAMWPCWVAEMEREVPVYA